MPTERWIGVVSKVTAICGSAVVMIVLSRFSMNNAVATISGTIMVGETGNFIGDASIGRGSIGGFGRPTHPVAAHLGPDIRREPHIEDAGRQGDQRHDDEHRA